MGKGRTGKGKGKQEMKVKEGMKVWEGRKGELPQ